ncbi:hypothetical protein [Streptomyces sp. NPDC058394]|uniref:hypothetical protein n=1 Tax=Streptomyces sp. NPDC058394 TaxID=3346477 RepID=UPI00365F6170
MRNAYEGSGPAFTAASPVRSEAPEFAYLDLAKKFTLTSAMSVVSASYALKNRTIRGAGFGVLAAYHMENSVEAGFKDPDTAVMSGLNVLGTAVWAAGIGTGNSIAQTLGPAINFTANVAFVGLKVCKKEGGWYSKVADVAEMAAFTAAGITHGNPLARGTAFAAGAVAYLVEAPKDPAFVGHAVGLGVWSAGAYLQSDLIQSIGAAGVAVSEIARTVVPVFQKGHGSTSRHTASPQASYVPDLESGVTSTTVPHEGPPPGAGFSGDVAEAATIGLSAHSVGQDFTAPHHFVPAVPSLAISAASTRVAEVRRSTDVIDFGSAIWSREASSSSPGRR